MELSIYLPNYFYYIDYTVDAMFFLDIIFTFRTVLIDESGKICTSKRKIYKKYLRGWFIIDIIASLPLDIIKIFFSEIFSQLLIFKQIAILILDSSKF